MLTREQLVGLYRRLRDEYVLSVYLDRGSTDPAARRAWRRRATGLLDREEERLGTTDLAGLERLRSARRHIEDALSSFETFLPERGWTGFATADALEYGESVPVPVPTLARWERGIRVAPYVRGLKHERTVVTVLADSRRARLFTFRDGEMEERADLIADTFLGDLSDVGATKRASGHTGMRGETASDNAKRALDLSSERLRNRLAGLVTELVPAEGAVVIGGPPEVAAALARQMERFGERVLEVPSMHVDMSASDIRGATEEAASELSRRAQQSLLDQVFDQALAGGKGSLGKESTTRALVDGRVETLLISRELRETEPDLADHCVGAAFEQGAAVEELAGTAALRLQSEGEGIAARLRYTI